MAKNSITDYSKTASLNTDIQSVDIDEGCLPSGINNAIRELMADLAAVNDGTVALTSPAFAAGSLTGNLSFGDNNKAIFGAGSDLQIYHDGSHSYITDAGQGDLRISGSSLVDIKCGSDIMIRATEGGATQLRYDGSPKLFTTATGIDVTGTVTADGLTVDGTGSEVISVNSTANGSQINFNSATSTSDWSVGISNDATDDFLIYQAGAGTGDVRIYTDGILRQEINHSGDISFYEDTGTTAKLTWDASEEDLKFADDSKAIFGAGSDLQIFHQSSNGNSIIQEQGGGILSIKTNGSEIALYDTVNATNMARFITGGAVKLFHNGSLKFETTSTGIDVTGTVTADGLTVDGSVNFSGLAPTVDYDFNASGSVTSADSLAYSKMGSGIATAVNISSVDTITPSWSALSGSTYSDNKFRIMSARGNATDALRIATSLTAEGHGDTTIIGNVDVDGVNTRLVSGLGIDGDSINLLADNSIRFKTNGNERARLTSDGRLGIGTSSPATTLDVDGTVTADGLTVDGSGTIRLNHATADDFLTITQGGTQAVITADSAAGAANLLFKTTAAGVDTNAMQLFSNGDISFYEDTGTTPKFFWDASAERLGVGTDSPQTLLDISHQRSGTRPTLNAGTRLVVESTANNTAFTAATILGGNASGASILNLGDVDDEDVGQVSYYHSDNSMRFKTNANERARLDASGNLLVGTTSTDPASSGSETGVALRGGGFASISRNDTAATVNINTIGSDGPLVDFRKNGSPVGSIGVNYGSRLYIGTADTGLFFNDLSDSIQPISPAGGLRGNAIDLGTAGTTFKDLYLGGGVYLGGTGDANKLRDYEEGTWTPVLKANNGTKTWTYNAQVGKYTKIGDTVTAWFNIQLTSNGSGTDGEAYVDGLPFANGVGFSVYTVAWKQLIETAEIGLMLRISDGNSYFWVIDGSSSYPDITYINTSSFTNDRRLRGQFTYKV